MVSRNRPPTPLRRYLTLDTNPRATNSVFGKLATDMSAPLAGASITAFHLAVRNPIERLFSVQHPRPMPFGARTNTALTISKIILAAITFPCRWQELRRLISRYTRFIATCVHQALLLRRLCIQSCVCLIATRQLIEVHRFDAVIGTLCRESAGPAGTSAARPLCHTRGSALVLANDQDKHAMSSTKPIKVSVLGMGMSATVFHIPFIKTLSNLFELHSIMERSATATKSEARSRYGNEIKVVTTIDEILNDPEVQCVVVGTPNSTHYGLAKSILQAGKHVIIEKPLTPSVSEANELIQIAKSHSPPLIIATYQNRRFDSDFLTLARLIFNGTLGNISSFETRYDRWRPQLKGGTWKEQAGKGQGVLYDLGSHLIDQVLVLFGIPNRIFGQIYNSRKLGPDDFDDAFFGTFFYDNVPGSNIPLVVHLHGSPLSAVEPQLRYSVKGTKGSFVKYGIDPQEDQLKLDPPMSTSDPAFGVEAEQLAGVLTLVQSDGTLKSERITSEHGRYLSWYENVGEALQDGDPSKLYVKPEQACEVIRMVELMYESSRSGKIVQVPKA